MLLINKIIKSILFNYLSVDMELYLVCIGHYV